MTVRRYTAYVFFSLSSICKFFGKLILNKEKGIIVDVLTMAGWFVLDECMIHQKDLANCKLIGFEWNVYPMPLEYVKMMRKLKRKERQK